MTSIRALSLRLSAAAILCSVSWSAMAQQAPTTRVRGTIESVNGDTVLIKSREGKDVTLHMAKTLGVSGVVKSSLSDVKQGSFIGVTTVPGSGDVNKAVEIHVFPESMRGTGEGSRPWDLKPNSRMTNAAVSDTVTQKDGDTLTLKYKGGEKKVVVAPDTIVVAFVPGDRSEIKPGAKVVAMAVEQADGSMQMSRVSVGRDGISPPM